MTQLRGGYPAPPGWPQDIPGMELAGEVAAARPRALALRARRPRDGDRRRRRPGRALPRPRARADGGARRRRLAGGRRPAGGLHDRPRRALHAVRPRARASACSSTAPPAASARPRSSSASRPARASTRPSATRRTATRSRRSARASIAPEDFVEHGPFDVILELVGAHEPRRQPRGARDRGAASRHRHGRRRDRPRSTCAADGAARARIHGSTLRARSLEEKAMTARALERTCCRCFAPAR